MAGAGRAEDVEDQEGVAERVHACRCARGGRAHGPEHRDGEAEAHVSSGEHLEEQEDQVDGARCCPRWSRTEALTASVPRTRSRCVDHPLNEKSRCVICGYMASKDPTECAVACDHNLSRLVELNAIKHPMFIFDAI